MPKLKLLRGKLFRVLKKYDGLAVACSGGLDSTFLAKFAAAEFPGRNLAVFHVQSPLVPEKESRFVEKWAKKNNLRLEVLKFNPFSYPNVKKNSRKRCYYCKKTIMKKIRQAARKLEIRHIADGTNLDDYRDFRPGMKASEELDILHPLAEAGLAKKDIRILSKHYGLPNWRLPSSACLASRIPYGTSLNKNTLKKIEKAENFLSSLGYAECRVRIYDGNACIEVASSKIKKIAGDREKITAKFKRFGFSKIFADLEGYRQGSMNLRDV